MNKLLSRCVSVQVNAPHSFTQSLFIIQKAIIQLTEICSFNRETKGIPRFKSYTNNEGKCNIETLPNLSMHSSKFILVIPHMNDVTSRLLMGLFKLQLAPRFMDIFSSKRAQAS